MKNEKDSIRYLWVYNKATGAIVRKSIVFRINSGESWYENLKDQSTYDAFFVDEDKESLRGRVHEELTNELQGVLKQAEDLVTCIRKLTKKV